MLPVLFARYIAVFPLSFGFQCVSGRIYWMNKKKYTENENYNQNRTTAVNGMKHK